MQGMSLARLRTRVPGVCGMRANHALLTTILCGRHSEGREAARHRGGRKGKPQVILASGKGKRSSDQVWRESCSSCVVCYVTKHIIPLFQTAGNSTALLRKSRAESHRAVASSFGG